MLTSSGRGHRAPSPLRIRTSLLFGACLAAGPWAYASTPTNASLPDAPSARLSAAAPHTLLVSLEAATTAPPLGDAHDAEQEPSAPPVAQNSQAPSLSDLGITNKEVQADPDLQAKLDRRSHMLKVHQRWGLITLVPMAAACISSIAAGPDPKKGGNDTWRDVHLALGATTAVSYGITASYAIRAPRVPHGQTKGAIKLHKILAWVHGPGMIATPILGAMAYNQAADGKKPTGAAAAHGAIATTTVIAYGAALLAVSLPIRMGGH